MTSAIGIWQTLNLGEGRKEVREKESVKRFDLCEELE